MLSHFLLLLLVSHFSKHIVITQTGNFINEIATNETVYVTGYNSTHKLYYQFSQDLLQTLEISLTNKNHQYNIFYKVINLNNMTVLFENYDNTDISLSIRDFIYNKQNYLLEIYSDTD